MVKDAVKRVGVSPKNGRNFVKQLMRYLPMKKVAFLLSILLYSYTSFAWQTDTVQTPRFFKGQITATNNGISLIPNFSLNRPAAMFDLSLGRGRLSFDPMIRFGLDGKPWTFVFWWRYKLVQQKRFTMSVGAHPSVVFREVSFTDNTGGETLQTEQEGGGVTLAVFVQVLAILSTTVILNTPALIK